MCIDSFQKRAAGTEEFRGIYKGEGSQQRHGGGRRESVNRANGETFASQIQIYFPEFGVVEWLV
jgi:hypothetical protein